MLNSILVNSLVSDAVSDIKIILVDCFGDHKFIVTEYAKMNIQSCMTAVMFDD